MASLLTNYGGLVAGIATLAAAALSSSTARPESDPPSKKRKHCETESSECVNKVEVATNETECCAKISKSSNNNNNCEQTNVPINVDPEIISDYNAYFVSATSSMAKGSDMEFLILSPPRTGDSFVELKQALQKIGLDIECESDYYVDLDLRNLLNKDKFACLSKAERALTSSLSSIGIVLCPVSAWGIANKEGVYRMTSPYLTPSQVNMLTQRLSLLAESRDVVQPIVNNAQSGRQLEKKKSRKSKVDKSDRSQLSESEGQ